MQSVLQSDINKYKKLYNDARNRALASSAGGTNGLTGNRNPLTVEEKDDGSSDTFDTRYKGTEEVDLDSEGFFNGGLIPAIWQGAAGGLLLGPLGVLGGAWRGLRHGNTWGGEGSVTGQVNNLGGGY